jgi:RNA polymerase sigma factor (sigma-70 family)
MRPPSLDAADRAVVLDDFLGAVRPKLNSTLASFKVPVIDAEDLVQDALLTLLEHDPNAIHNPEAWLVGTLKNKIRRYWRRQKRHQQLLVLLSRDAATSDPPRQEHLGLVRDLVALTAHLPPRSLMALWLRYGLGRKPREVARVLRCRPDSVRKLTRRALVLVRRRLAAVSRLDAATRTGISRRPDLVGGPSAAGTNRQALPAADEAATRAPASRAKAAPLALVNPADHETPPHALTLRGAHVRRFPRHATPNSQGRHRP